MAFANPDEAPVAHSTSANENVPVIDLGGGQNGPKSLPNGRFVWEKPRSRPRGTSQNGPRDEGAKSLP